MKTFDFWFDFGSPAAYLAATQIAAMEEASGATANWRPMLLGGVFQATGNSSPVTVPAKGRYSFGDFSRFAKRYGVPLSVNPHFPINTLMLMRGAEVPTSLYPRVLERMTGLAGTATRAAALATAP